MCGAWMTPSASRDSRLFTTHRRMPVTWPPGRAKARSSFRFLPGGLQNDTACICVLVYLDVFGRIAVWITHLDGNGTEGNEGVLSLYAPRTHFAVGLSRFC